MIRSFFRRRLLAIAVLAVLIAGPVYALVNSNPGGFMPVAGPVPAGQYIQPITISPSLYGDVIVGIETGRDDRSPYVAIVVDFFQGTSPLVAGVNNPWVQQVVPYIPVIPNFPNVAPYTRPLPVPPGFRMRFVYRPINDPANPGWGPGPATASQIESAMQTCTAVAAELTAFRARAHNNVPALVPLGTPLQFPQLYLEIDPNPGLTQLEFYKFQIIR